MKFKPITLKTETKYRLAYQYFVDNIPLHSLAENKTAPLNLIREFLSSLLNDPKIREIYLPKQNLNYLRTLNEVKMGGYYEGIEELKIGEIPQYWREGDNIEREGIFLNQTDNRSFTEIYNEMREVTDPREIEEMKQDLFDLRISEQKNKGDYADRLDDGSLERCVDCGTPINSHDHCPRCDY